MIPPWIGTAHPPVDDDKRGEIRISPVWSRQHAGLQWKFVRPLEGVVVVASSAPFYVTVDREIRSGRSG